MRRPMSLARRSACAVLAASIGCWSGWVAASEPPRYRAVPLGTLGYWSHVEGQAINARGDVAGWIEFHHAFLHRDGAMRDLGTLGGPSSKAFAVNRHGWTTGRAYASQADTYAFVSDGSTMSAIVAAGQGATGYGINDSGHVAGQMLVGGAQRAFVYASGTVTNLGAFGEASSVAWGINGRGEVIVEARTGELPRAFIVRRGSVTPLGTLGGGGTAAYAINEGGDITGGSQTADGKYHAYLYTRGTMIDLGSLDPGYGSVGRAINAAGDVVGTSSVYRPGPRPNVLQRAIIVPRGGRMHDLRSLVVEGLGLPRALTEAVGINDLGQIVANSCDDYRFFCEAFRLDPLEPVEVPALGPVALAATALALLAAARRRLASRATS